MQIDDKKLFTYASGGCGTSGHYITKVQNFCSMPPMDRIPLCVARMTLEALMRDDRSKLIIAKRKNI